MPDPENNNNIDPSDTKVATDDVKQRPQSVKPENDKSKTKISVTQESATEGRFETPVIEKAKMTSLEQHAEYIDQPENNDGNVAIPEENNQRFEKFLESFEKNYWDTNCNWVDEYTKGLGNAYDIKTLKAQLTNLIKASTRNDWIAASSAVIIGPLSNTLSKIFGVNDDSNDAVKSRVNDVIKKQQQQKLLQNFLEKLETSCLPFDANAWLDNLNSSTSFNQNLKQPLWDFMQCVTGEEYSDIPAKVMALGEVLCEIFAVNNTNTKSVTTRLEGIVQCAREAQETTKKKYNADIVDNLLKVIDFVDAKGYVNLNPDSNIRALINHELCGFIKTPEKRQGALDVIYRILKGATIKLNSETIAQSSATLLVNSGVINTGDKDKAVKKITSKIQDLRNKRNNESSTTEEENFVLKPKIVKTNTAQVQQETSSPATDPQQLASQDSELQNFLDALEKSFNSGDKTN